MSSKFTFAACVFYVAAILLGTQWHKQIDRRTDKVVSAREEEHGYDDPLKFFELQQEMRTRDGARAPAYAPGYKLKELEKAILRSREISSQARTMTNVLEWTERGPNNIPGRTRALWNIPHAQNNTWLAGAATGGIWKTTDGGNTWTEKNDALTSFPIASLAGDATSSKIYAGTGEYISSIASALGDGIFVSTDQGENWAPLQSTQGNNDFSIVTRIIVNPGDANMILASTVPSLYDRLATKAKIMRSVNGGASWTKVLEVDGAIDQIIFAPDDFNVQYASQRAVGIWKSTDGGVTWTLLDGPEPDGRMEIAVSPVNSNRLFVSAEGGLSGTESDLYTSTDAGATWGLVPVEFDDAPLDFLGVSPTEADSQGFYDNTIICDPFNADIIYYGGINLFRSVVSSSPSGTLASYDLIESNTESFLELLQFANIEFANQRLTVGSNADEQTVEIRFGPGKTQKAHRFLVPENTTNGVAVASYSFADVVDVPFEVWDVTGTPRQLMASFRDQNRNGAFDLLEQFLTSDGVDYLLNSREYLYINNVTYSASPDPNISKSGGQEYRLMYNVFPALAPGAVYTPNNLPQATLSIVPSSIPSYSSATVTVADGYGSYDGKNTMDQRNFDQGVHVDHHFMIPVIENPTTKTYKIVLGNDGGVFVSNVATNPGINDGNWSFRGFGYNTSQFYSADKMPGSQVYFGGLQDNGTRISPAGVVATATTNYAYAFGGDGFDVLWHSRDPNKLLGSVYFGAVQLSENGGVDFNDAVNGLPQDATFPFFTRLAYSKDYPERVFTVSTQGVHRSNNFGKNWETTTIDDDFAGTSANALHVEVSRANANVVWAGSGMSNTAGFERSLHVSVDGGTSFTKTSNFNAVTLGSISGIATHPFQQNTAYVLFSFADGPKILRTTDLGATWEDITGFGTGSASTNGFPDVAVYSLYVRPDNPNVIWAGTEIGIVESTNNGATWALLNDFPKVSVISMVGQDNEVVIATHGRGIWTATIDAPQSDFAVPPVIAAAGTNPRGNLALRITVEEAFDLVEVYVNGEVAEGVLEELEPGTYDVELSGLTAGDKELTLISYRDGAPYQSIVKNVELINLTSVRSSYSTYFQNLSDFDFTSGLSLKNFPGEPASSKKSVQTDHPYKQNTRYELFLKSPVKVAAGSSQLFYGDIAITEPGVDQVFALATKNGLDWVELIPPYSAADNSAWQTAFGADQNGTREMIVAQQANLLDHFSAGDTILFSWVLRTNETTDGWGWAIDYIAIQETPTQTEVPTTAASLRAYPNPTSGNLNIYFTQTRQSRVDLRMMDLIGRRMAEYSFGDLPPGTYEKAIDISQFAPGTFILLVNTSDGNTAIKVVKN